MLHLPRPFVSRCVLGDVGLSDRASACLIIRSLRARRPLMTTLSLGPIRKEYTSPYFRRSLLKSSALSADLNTRTAPMIGKPQGPGGKGFLWWNSKSKTKHNPVDNNIEKTKFASNASLKAILQVLIYKALYDKSYLGSKTTMTSGEWTCLISFATAPLTCSERGGSEKFKMKIYVSSGIRTHNPPVHDRKVAAP